MIDWLLNGVVLVVALFLLYFLACGLVLFYVYLRGIKP